MGYGDDWNGKLSNWYLSIDILRLNIHNILFFLHWNLRNVG